jgi:hypothetical protein
MKKITLIILLFLLSACGSLGRRYEPLVLRDKNIVIQVLLKDELQLKWIGTTVFNNVERKQAAPNWGLAADVAAHLQEMLKQSNCAGCTFSIIAANDSSDGADLLLKITPAMGEQVLDTNQSYQGVAIIQRSVFGMKPYSTTAAALTMALIDLKTGKILREVSVHELGGGAVMLDESMALSAEQLVFAQSLTGSVARRASTVCLEQIGLKPFVGEINQQGRVKTIK